MPLGAIQIPFPDSSMPGTPGHFQESGGRLINCYVEPLAPTAPSQIIYRRAPGLRNFGTTVRAGFRGAIEVNSVLYCAFGNRLVTLGAAGGAATDVGALTGTAKGFFARNMLRPTPNIVFCDPDGNYAKIDPSTGTITPNYDTDLPSPNSVCVLDNFFVYTISDGRAFASDFNSADVQPLSFGTAEAKADGLIRGVSWAGQLFLMGPSSTEVWANAGTTPFPFQRSVVIPRGIAGPYCVSGFEDNFSRALCWVADDNTVVRLNGYTPEKISPPDLDGLIELVTNKSQLEMSCFISRGHAFILLSSLTWSWVFDLNNNKWQERDSYLQKRSRITGGVFSFGRWLCGDLLSGNVQEITNQVHTEVGQPFRWRIESGAVENFPVGARVGRFDAEFVTGVGVVTAARVRAVITAAAGDAFTTPTGTANRIRLTVDDTTLMNDGDAVVVSGIVGTTAANGNWTADVVDFPQLVLGAAAGTAGRIRITIGSTVIMHSGGKCTVTGVLGTTEANGTWVYNVIDGTNIELVGSTFVHAWVAGGTQFFIDRTHVQLAGSTFNAAYVSGGTITDLAPFVPSETDPVVEISWSDDGGQTYYAPIQRKLGRQAETRQLVSLIACTGRSSWNARRWRLDIADPVHVGFMAAYQNQSPKVSDIG